MPLPLFLDIWRIKPELCQILRLLHDTLVTTATMLSSYIMSQMQLTKNKTRRQEVISRKIGVLSNKVTLKSPTLGGHWVSRHWEYFNRILLLCLRYSSTYLSNLHKHSMRRKDLLSSPFYRQAKWLQELKQLAQRRPLGQLWNQAHQLQSWRAQLWHVGKKKKNSLLSLTKSHVISDFTTISILYSISRSIII